MQRAVLFVAALLLAVCGGVQAQEQLTATGPPAALRAGGVYRITIGGQAAARPTVGAAVLTITCPASVGTVSPASVCLSTNGPQFTLTAASAPLGTAAPCTFAVSGSQAALYTAPTALSYTIVAADTIAVTVAVGTAAAVAPGTIAAPTQLAVGSSVTFSFTPSVATAEAGTLYTECTDIFKFPTSNVNSAKTYAAGATAAITYVVASAGAHIGNAQCRFWIVTASGNRQFADIAPAYFVFGAAPVTPVTNVVTLTLNNAPSGLVNLGSATATKVYTGTSAITVSVPSPALTGANTVTVNVACVDQSQAAGAGITVASSTLTFSSTTTTAQTTDITIPATAGNFGRWVTCTYTSATANYVVSPASWSAFFVSTAPVALTATAAATPTTVAPGGTLVVTIKPAIDVLLYGQLVVQPTCSVTGVQPLFTVGTQNPTMGTSTAFTAATGATFTYQVPSAGQTGSPTVTGADVCSFAIVAPSATVTGSTNGENLRFTAPVSLTIQNKVPAKLTLATSPSIDFTAASRSVQTVLAPTTTSVTATLALPSGTSTADFTTTLQCSQSKPTGVTGFLTVAPATVAFAAAASVTTTITLPTMAAGSWYEFTCTYVTPTGADNANFVFSTTAPQTFYFAVGTRVQLVTSLPTGGSFTVGAGATSTLQFSGPSGIIDATQTLYVTSSCGICTDSGSGFFQAFSATVSQVTTLTGTLTPTVYSLGKFQGSTAGTVTCSFGLVDSGNGESRHFIAPANVVFTVTAAQQLRITGLPTAADTITGCVTTALAATTTSVTIAVQGATTPAGVSSTYTLVCNTGAGTTAGLTITPASFTVNPTSSAAQNLVIAFTAPAANNGLSVSCSWTAAAGNTDTTWLRPVDFSFYVGPVATLVATASSTTFQAGTSQDVILNFGAQVPSQGTTVTASCSYPPVAPATIPTVNTFPVSFTYNVLPTAAAQKFTVTPSQVGTYTCTYRISSPSCSPGLVVSTSYSTVFTVQALYTIGLLGVPTAAVASAASITITATPSVAVPAAQTLNLKLNCQSGELASETIVPAGTTGQTWAAAANNGQTFVITAPTLPPTQNGIISYCRWSLVTQTTATPPVTTAVYATPADFTYVVGVVNPLTANAVFDAQLQGLGVYAQQKAVTGATVTTDSYPFTISSSYGCLGGTRLSASCSAGGVVTVNNGDITSNTISGTYRPSDTAGADSCAFSLTNAYGSPQSGNYFTAPSALTVTTAARAGFTITGVPTTPVINTLTGNANTVTLSIAPAAAPKVGVAATITCRDNANVWNGGQSFSTVSPPELYWFDGVATAQSVVVTVPVAYRFAKFTCTVNAKAATQTYVPSMPLPNGQDVQDKAHYQATVSGDIQVNNPITFNIGGGVGYQPLCPTADWILTATPSGPVPYSTTLALYCKSSVVPTTTLLVGSASFSQADTTARNIRIRTSDAVLRTLDVYTCTWQTRAGTSTGQVTTSDIGATPPPAFQLQVGGTPAAANVAAPSIFVAIVALLLALVACQ